MKVKKRALSLLLAVLMVVGMLPALAFAADDEARDISVGSAAELAALGGQDIVGNITLTNDIDMSGTAMTPIKSLKGCFNGDGKTIAGLALTGDKGSYSYTDGTVYVNTGLIGELDGSVINVKMTDVTITGLDQYNNVGVLVGKIADGSDSKIDNCTVSGTITSTSGSGTTLIGGLVGYATGAYQVNTTLAINNCVSNVTLSGGSSNYVGGLVGSAQTNATLSITKCAQLADFGTNKGLGAGIVGYANGSTVDIANSYLAGKVSASSYPGVIAYSGKRGSATISLSGDFYYNEANSYELFQKASGYSGTVANSDKAQKKSTADLKALKLDGFEVRDGEFSGYPVPVWTPATAPEPITPPAPAFSCALTFTGAEGGTLTVKHGETTLTANENDGYAYTLSEAGDYSYSVAFGADSDYNDVPETAFTVGEDETAKTIKVPLTYKTTEPSGDGTEESPIFIGTAAELRAFANKVNSGNSAAAHAYVKLTDNITIPGSWTPLGKNASFPFSGHFDGDHHRVKITVDDPSLGYFGFFGCLDSQPNRDSATAIDDQPTVIVENLTVNGTIYCSEPYTFVGGIAGRARGKVGISSCVNNATISSLARGSAGVGGLVGGYDDGVDYVYKNIRLAVDGCENNGTISVSGDNTNAMVGGLVGSNANCVQVKDSTNNGTINAPGCTVGGLLGEAGSQTGDCKPSIADSANNGTLIGAKGKTNNLYGKGTISSGNVTNSGGNTYTGGNASADVLVAESQKYNDVLAVPATAQVGDEVALSLKSGMEADTSITVTLSQGDRDTNKAYLKVGGGKLQLAQPNSTGKVIEATATVTWSKDGKSLSKPVTVNIYPAASSRTELMQRIAATYAKSSEDWVVFDMAAYAKCGFGTNTTDTENYLNLTINELAGTSPLATDRAKAEIILAALGIDSTRLTPLNGAEYSNAAKLAAMNLGTSHYTAPWVLLAEQAGQVKLSDKQRSSMISLLTSSLGPDGLFVTKWAGETFADPDTTGTALAALAKYNTEDHPAVQAFITKAVAGLSAAQRDNGSFGNVNSDAMVITGLTALGIDPGADARFVKGSCSLADALLLYVNDAKNGFSTGYISGTQGEKAQALATEQGFRALVTLEQFAKDTSKAFNIYTLSTAPASSTDPDNPDNPGQPLQPEQPKPGTATGSGTLPSEGGSTGGGSTGGGSTGGGSEKSWISVVVTIQPSSGSAWYEGSVKVANGATVEKALRTAADDAGLSLNIKNGYLRAVTRGSVTLGQFDEGPNSGWLYKVNGKAPNVGIADYELSGGDTVRLYFTADYTKESDLDISHPSSGGVAAGGAQNDQKAADAVSKLISAIGTVTKDSADQITAARKAYDKLTAAQKKLVTNYDKLTAAEKAYADLAGTVLPRFSDVTVSDYFYQAVLWALEKNVTNGLTDTTFAPQLSCTRAQMVTFLWRAAGSPAPKATVNPFTDVPAGAYYEKAVLWAIENGVTQGTSAATFSPDAVCTRGQMAAFLYRSKNSPAVSGASPFTDVQPADYYADAVVWATENDITNGIGNNQYGPAQPCTRGQIVTFLYRAAVK